VIGTRLYRDLGKSQFQPYVRFQVRQHAVTRYQSGLQALSAAGGRTTTIEGLTLFLKTTMKESLGRGIGRRWDQFVVAE
jgi:hypothetical protein